MKNKLFVVSDIHLEHKSLTEQSNILNSINQEIYHLDRTLYQPIILLCGDIGSLALELIAKIDAVVLYVLGNHEYWQQDYFEAKQKYQELASQYSHIHLLDNNIYYLNNQLFIGTTLWTDCGLHLNSDLVNASARVMRDTTEITAKQWYDSKDNVKKLALANMLTDKPVWNNLIQIEENAKAVEFINMCYSIIHLLTKLNKYLDIALITSTPQLISECLKKGLLQIHSFDESVTKICFDGLCEQYDYYFNLFKSRIDLSYVNQELQCINMSHHHPFYEDIFIHSKPNSELLFSTQKGTIYPYHNYFYEMSRGRVYDNENLFNLIHYHTNGSKLFNQHVLFYTKIWAFGHKHYHNFNDKLKSIHLVSNPYSSASSNVLLEIEINDKEDTIQQILNSEVLTTLLDYLKVLYKDSQYVYKKNVYHLHNNTLDKWHKSNTYLNKINHISVVISEYISIISNGSKLFNIAENTSFSYANEYFEKTTIGVYTSIDFNKFEQVLLFIKEPKDYHDLLHQFLYELTYLIKNDIKHLTSCIKQEKITQPKSYSFYYQEEVPYNKFVSIAKSLENDF